MFLEDKIQAAFEKLDCLRNIFLLVEEGPHAGLALAFLEHFLSQEAPKAKIVIIFYTKCVNDICDNIEKAVFVSTASTMSNYVICIDSELVHKNVISVPLW